MVNAEQSGIFRHGRTGTIQLELYSGRMGDQVAQGYIGQASPCNTESQAEHSTKKGAARTLTGQTVNYFHYDRSYPEQIVYCFYRPLKRLQELGVLPVFSPSTPPPVTQPPMLAPSLIETISHSPPGDLESRIDPLTPPREEKVDQKETAAAVLNPFIACSSSLDRADTVTISSEHNSEEDLDTQITKTRAEIKEIGTKLKTEDTKKGKPLPRNARTRKSKLVYLESSEGDVVKQEKTDL